MGPVRQAQAVPYLRLSSCSSEAMPSGEEMLRTPRASAAPGETKLRWTLSFSWLWRPRCGLEFAAAVEATSSAGCGRNEAGDAGPGSAKAPPSAPAAAAAVGELSVDPHDGRGSTPENRSESPFEVRGGGRNDGTLRAAAGSTVEKAAKA